MSGHIFAFRLLEQDFLRTACHLRTVAVFQFLRNLRGPFRARSLFRVCQLSGHGCSRRSPAPGIREDMHLRKIALAHERQRLSKFFLCFARKAYDEIGRHRAAVEIRLQKLHAFQKPGCIVFAVHPFQNRVTAALQTQVELRAEILTPGQCPAEIGVDRARFERAQPDTKFRHRLAQSQYKLAQRAAVTPFPAPGGYLNAVDHDFAVSLCLELPGLTHGLIKRH